MNAKPATSYPEVVGRLISRLRKEKKIDQANLAKGIGITQSTLSKLERGDSVLNIAQIYMIAEELKLPPAEIFSLADQAVGDLNAKGVMVESEKSKILSESDMVLVAATLIGGIIGYLVSRR